MLHFDAKFSTKFSIILREYTVVLRFFCFVSYSISQKFIVHSYFELDKSNNFRINFDHILQAKDKTTSEKSSGEEKRKLLRDQVEIVIYRSCCDEKYPNLSGCKPENW